MVPAAKGARITGEEREQLMLSCVRRYRAGESIRSLAADTGRSYGFIQGLLKEAGVPLRARGGATRGAEAEADRRERQARVEAVRAAEQVGEDVDGASGLDDPPLTGEGAGEPSGQRDLDRAPTSPADLGLPTPPLGVLVKKKSKGRSKAKRIAAEKAKEGNGPRILALLEEASATSSPQSPGRSDSAEKSAKKDKAPKHKKAKKDKKDKKDKASRKDGVGADRKPKKSSA